MNRLARPLAVVVVAGVAIAAAACATSATGAGAPSTQNASTSSTTTTTTLPPTPALGDSTPSGSFSFLGPVRRVRVFAAIAGGIEVPPPPTTPGVDPAAVHLGFRSFGSGPDLVLVAGEHATMTWWDPAFLQLLSQHFTVTIFDLPGVGYSQPSATPLSLDQEADLTAGLIVALGLQKNGVTLAGWGLGGTIALDAVARHPGLATGLALIDALAPGPLEVPPGAEVASAFADPLATEAALSFLFVATGETAARVAWLQRVEELAPDDQVASSVRAEAALVSSIPSETSLAGALGRLDLPVRVLTGSDDRVVPSENATRLAASIHHARLIVVPNGGYAPFVTDPDRVLESLQSLAG